MYIDLRRNICKPSCGCVAQFCIFFATSMLTTMVMYATLMIIINATKFNLNKNQCTGRDLDYLVRYDNVLEPEFIISGDVSYFDNLNTKQYLLEVVFETYSNEDAALKGMNKYNTTFDCYTDKNIFYTYDVKMYDTYEIIWVVVAWTFIALTVCNVIYMHKKREYTSI